MFERLAFICRPWESNICWFVIDLVHRFVLPCGLKTERISGHKFKPNDGNLLKLYYLEICIWNAINEYLQSKCYFIVLNLRPIILLLLLLFVSLLNKGILSHSLYFSQCYSSSCHLMRKLFKASRRTYSYIDK